MAPVEDILQTRKNVSFELWIFKIPFFCLFPTEQYIASLHPEYFKQSEQYQLLELHAGSMEFYSVFGLTLMFGIYSTTLSLKLASRMINVNSPDPTYGLEEDL